MLAPEQFDELKESLCAEMRSAVAEAVKPYRSRMEAAAFLSVSPDFIDLKKRQGKLKPLYIGARPLYPVAQLVKLPTARKGAA